VFYAYSERTRADSGDLTAGQRRRPGLARTADVFAESGGGLAACQEGIDEGAQVHVVAGDRPWLDFHDLPGADWPQAVSKPSSREMDDLPWT
jgi:hypothetical protein